MASTSDALTWKSTNSAATTKADFGVPTTTTAYDVCLYDERAGTPTLVVAAQLPGGATCGSRACWRETSRGFKYADSKSVHGPVRALVLQDGTAGKAKITLTAKGTDLGLPLAQDRTVVIQLGNGTTCWEARFSTATTNDTRKFKATSDPRARLYATFVSHNEESANYVCSRQQPAYLANRELMRAFADMIIDRRAAWDMQTEWLYLEAVRQWDIASVMTATRNKTIVRYLAELDPARITVDAHAHETQYNYADVVHLLDEFGIARNGVVGGFIYYPPTAEVWTRLEQPLRGAVFPDTTWTADILWGAATAMHQGPDSQASGIWRPRDATHFHTDDPAQRLVNVGGYTGASGVDDLLGKLRAGILTRGRMYTLSIFFNQCSLTAAQIDSYAALIEAHAADVEAGDLVWAPLPEMVRIWRDDYGSVPVILQPDGVTPPY